MSAEDPLYALVHSLDQDEIKFLRTFVPPGYTRIPKPVLALFEAILAQASYDKASLEAEFKGLRKKRSMLKEYVLKCMRIFGDEKDVRAKVSAHLRDYEFLYTKGLYDASIKSLVKARELAEKYEFTGILTYLLNLEKRRLMESTKRDLGKTVAQKNQEIESWLTSYSAEIQAESEYHKLLSLFRLGGESIAEIKAMALRPGFATTSMTVRQTFFTKVYHITSRFIAARANLDDHLVLQHLAELLDHWNLHSEIKSIHLPKYRITLGNYATLCLGAGYSQLALVLIEEFEALPAIGFNQQAEHFQNLILLRILHSLNELEASNTLAITEEVSQGIEQYHAKINLSRGLAIRCNLLHLLLVDGYYSEALAWAKSIIAERRYSQRKEIYNDTRLLQLVIYYELDNMDDLENETNACYQYLHNNTYLNDYAKLVISHIRKLLRSPSHQEKLELFQSLRANLDAYAVRGEPGAIGYNILNAWARSKVTGESVREALYRNMNGNK